MTLSDFEQPPSFWVWLIARASALPVDSPERAKCLEKARAIRARDEARRTLVDAA